MSERAEERVFGYARVSSTEQHLDRQLAEQQDKTDEALDTFKNGISVINEQSSPDIVSDFYSIMGDLLHEKG
ncbi:MAG: hypothetical protein SO170_09675, partial [Butyribacter sp.]|nr:hypothetical protein [Butyribacter sp.]